MNNAIASVAVAADLWGHVRKGMLESLASLGVSLDALVVEKVLVDPSHTNGERADEFDWIDRSHLSAIHVDFQDHFFLFPGSEGPVARNLTSVQMDTIDLLSACLDNPDHLLAALALAHCANIQSSYSLPDGTPALQQVAADYLGINPRQVWHWSVRNTLPEGDNHSHLDEQLPLSRLTIDAEIQRAAKALSRLVNKYALVRFTFGEDLDPAVDSELKAREAMRRRRAEESQLRHDELVALKAHLDAQRAAKRDTVLVEKGLADRSDKRVGELSRSELEELVWSMPTADLAVEFGVSDTAVKKHCRRHGIIKPKRGFWAKVNAGRLPHPKGVPVTS